jgi:hypothetical protein
MTEEVLSKTIKAEIEQWFDLNSFLAHKVCRLQWRR